MILQSTFQGDPNLGIFFSSNENFCLVPVSVERKNIERIESCLGVKVIKAKISGTNLLGMFSVSNSSGLLVSNLITSKEFEKLRKELKSFDMNLAKINSRYSAIGNLILCNDKGAIISELLSDKRKKIEDCLGVESVSLSLAGLKVVGSCGVATNKGCLLHRDVSEEEMKKVKDVLKVKVDIGTANFGSPFVGCCMIANSKGALVGKPTTGPELARIMETLHLKLK